MSMDLTIYIYNIFQMQAGIVLSHQLKLQTIYGKIFYFFK